MAAITISREFGSEGMDIAKKVADELGFLLIDKQIIGDLLGQYGLVEFRKVYESVPAFWESFDSQKMEQRKITIDMMNRTILALAAHGNVVIVGRGGYLVLANYVDVLNVSIRASISSRVNRTMKDFNISDRLQAEALVVENDTKRERFIESTYGSHRDRAKDFDLVVNTDKIPAARAIALIVEAGKNLGKDPSAGGHTLRTIEIDLVLKSVINKMLDKR